MNYPLSFLYWIVLLYQDPHTGETVKEMRSEKVYTFEQCQEILGGVSLQVIDPSKPDLIVKAVCEPVTGGRST